MKDKRQIIDVMIDLETLGTSQNAHIMNIALAIFPTNVRDARIAPYINYLDIFVEGDHQENREISDDTYNWWTTGERVETYERLCTRIGTDGRSAEESAEMVYRTLSMLSESDDIRIWGRGIQSFDWPILCNFCEEYGWPISKFVKFYNVMDVRSIVNAMKVCGYKMVTEPSLDKKKHFALNDCFKQINEVYHFFNIFNKPIDFAKLNQISILD